MPMRNTMPSKGEDVQPYKYNGKELDRMQGLNTYDHAAGKGTFITDKTYTKDELRNLQKGKVE